MNVKIPVGRFVCPKGKVKAEGKAARPPFCYRIRVSRGKVRATTIELHSKVTGRRIGYIADKPSLLITPERSGARVWTESSGGRQSTPEMVDQKMKHFLKTAQDPSFEPKATKQYRKLSAEAWKKILREARKR